MAAPQRDEDTGTNGLSESQTWPGKFKKPEQKSSRVISEDENLFVLTVVPDSDSDPGSGL